MATHVARHGARKRTSGAANAFEAFAVAGGALTVVALMTLLAGGPAQVGGAVTGEGVGPGNSQGVSPTSVGYGSHAPRSTTGPVGTAAPSSATRPATVFPPGPPTTAPPNGLGPSSPLPVGTTPVGITLPAADPAAPPSSKATKPTPPVHPTPPVTPGVPPADPPRATPRG
jgi:hypothetical protein